MAEVREDRSGFLNLILGFFDEPVGGGRVKNLFSEVRRDLALILHDDDAMAFSEDVVIGGVALLVMAGLGFVVRRPDAGSGEGGEEKAQRHKVHHFS